MAKKTKTLFIWEAVGVLLIFLAGAALHFAFEWSGRWTPLAVIAAANESTWEHLKLAFWPGLILAAIEWAFIGKQFGNFWLGKALGLLTMVASIVVLFYGYQLFLEDSLFMDILIFFIAVFLGQLASYTMIKGRTVKAGWRSFGKLLLILLILAFALLTYYPPHCFLFLDPATGGYGLGAV